MRSLYRIIESLRRLRRDEKAVAAVEFALIVPFLITLYMGSIEGAALFTVDKRVNSISATVGDLVAQWDPGDGDLAVATITDYFNASTGIITPYSTAGLKIVVTLVKVKADGTTSVIWSRANGAGTAKIAGSSYTGLTAASMINQVSQGGCIVAAETSYSYKPILGQVFTTALELKHTNYFLPRFGSTKPINLDITNPDLAGTACTAA